MNIADEFRLSQLGPARCPKSVADGVISGRG